MAGGGHAGVVYEVSDPEAATKVLTQNVIKLYDQDELRVTE